MEKVMQLGERVVRWIQPWWAKNVTFSLLLAVLTEVPRWTFAFRAVNEPLWAGVPLAVLIAFAAAHAWEEYFFEHDWLLLALNLVSVVFAVFTIAPVLYAMIDAEAHEVNIAHIFPVAVRWLWAVVLACTTFLPLIQLAVVEARRRGRMQPVQVKAVPSRDAVQAVQDADASDEDAVQGDWVGYAMQLRSAGRTFKEIASEVNKHESTVSRRLNGVHA
jgi:predicted DNA-binding transcriptional regulator